MVAQKKSVTSRTKKATSVSLEIPMYDLSGGKKTPAKVSKEIFGNSINEKLLAQYVRVYLTNQRQGTVSTKTRAEIVSSKRKIYRQKGTGRARHGARSAPIFVGGGVAFGPKPRSFSLKINKKQKKRALFGALTLALQNKNILGLSDEATNVKPKTREVFSFLKKLDFDAKRILLVLPHLEKNNLLLASRNIPNLEIIDAKSLNTFKVLRHEKIIFLKKALTILEDHFLKQHEN